MKNHLSKLVLGMASLALVTGCKQGNGNGQPEKSEWVDKIKISNNQVKFEYITTFADSLEADIEGEFPINKYGSIIFFNDELGRFNVGVSAVLDLFKAPNLDQVTTLPNGARFPRIVTGPLHQLEISSNNKHKLYAFVDKNALTGSGQRLAGLALQMDSIRNNFPQVSITQSFFKGDKRYASFTMYGPREVNGKMVPGGLFLIGDTNMAINQATNVWANQPTVHGPEASQFESIDAKMYLLKQAQKVLAENGIYVKF